MKTILAPIDFSSSTDLVCKTAATLAKAVNARVVLMTAVPPPIITSEYGSMLENVGEIAAAAEKAAARQLSRVKSKMERQFVVTETIHSNGSPVAAILEHAKKLDADYIVLGSHGHTALYELLVGSTAHGVLMEATCPVVIVPQKHPAAKKKVRRKAA